MSLLKNLDSFFGDDEDTIICEIKEIELSKLHEFKDHPFKVIEDESMELLKDSIAENGVLMPIIVREVEENYFEILSGHRRKKACELLELETIPCLVRAFDDEESTILMVDSNLQREYILPSEKAFAYKLKFDAIKKQGKRTDLTSAQVGLKLERKNSIDEIAENSTDSRNQIKRYIRLTELTTSLLDMVDAKKLPFNSGVELSYLNSNEQEKVTVTMEVLEVIPSIQQATKLKKYSTENGLTSDLIESILSETKVKPIQVTLKQDKLKEYFKDGTSKEEIENTIIDLLSKWSKAN